MDFWTWLSALDPDTRSAVIAFLASVGGTVGTIFGVALTVGATAWLGIRQLGQQASDARMGRTLEIKRETLLAGIRGMGRARLACAKLCLLDEPIEKTMLEFQEGLSAMTSAAAVADIRVVRQGRDFANTIGPIVMDMLRERNAIERTRAAEGDWRVLHGDMLRANVSRVARVNEAELRAIAAIRGDIGVDEPGDAHERLFVESAQVDMGQPLAKMEEALTAAGYPVVR